MAEEWSEDRIRGIVRDELAAAEAEASLLSKFVDDLLG